LSQLGSNLDSLGFAWLGLPTALWIGAGITLLVSFVLDVALIAWGRTLDR
jgi:hypothetical protein